MVIGLIIVVFLAVLFLTRAPYLGIAAAMAGGVLTVTAAYAVSLIWRGTWECRVEGTALSFHRPQDRGWVVMQGRHQSRLPTLVRATMRDEPILSFSCGTARACCSIAGWSEMKSGSTGH